MGERGVRNFTYSPGGPGGSQGGRQVLPMISQTSTDWDTQRWSLYRRWLTGSMFCIKKTRTYRRSTVYRRLSLSLSNQLSALHWTVLHCSGLIDHLIDT